MFQPKGNEISSPESDTAVRDENTNPVIHSKLPTASESGLGAQLCAGISCS